MKKLSIPVLLALLFAGCLYKEVGYTPYAGFTELPFPNNSYAVGQIVRILSLPKTVEITYDPNIPWDSVTPSPGWDLSKNEKEKVISNLESRISEALKDRYDHASEETVKIGFKDPTMNKINTSTIGGILKEDIEKNVGLRIFLNDYIEDGSEFYVITKTFSAKISFSLKDPNGGKVVIDSDVIDKLNSKFNLDFERKGDMVITGSDLVVGFYYDKKMVQSILDRIAVL